MNIADLMDIQVGKKYLWKTGATELPCPQCGKPIGGNPDRPEILVTVIGLIEGSEGITCDECKTNIGDKYPGFYVVKVEHAYNHFAVPYPQLSKIKEEDYDR